MSNGQRCVCGLRTGRASDLALLVTVTPLSLVSGSNDSSPLGNVRVDRTSRSTRQLHECHANQECSLTFEGALLHRTTRPEAFCLQDGSAKVISIVAAGSKPSRERKAIPISDRLTAHIPSLAIRSAGTSIRLCRLRSSAISISPGVRPLSAS